MEFNVRMMTCGTWETIKKVILPVSVLINVDEEAGDSLDTYDILEGVFKYGQNEFAVDGTTKTLPSVSVGDVVEFDYEEIDPTHYIVAPNSFEELTDEQVEELKAATEPLGYTYAYGFLKEKT